MLWLGGGAREAGAAATELVERGFCVVTSTNGRAVVPEAHPAQSRRLQHDAAGAGDLPPRRSDDRRRIAPARQRDPQQSDGAAAAAGADRRRSERRAAAIIPSICSSTATRALRSEGLCARLPEKLDVDHGFGHEVSVARARARKARCASSSAPISIVADVLLDARRRGPASVRARRHDLQLHLRQSLCGDRRAPSRRACARRRHRTGHCHGDRRGAGVRQSPKTVALLGDGGAMVNLGGACSPRSRRRPRSCSC